MEFCLLLSHFTTVLKLCEILYGQGHKHTYKYLWKFFFILIVAKCDYLCADSPYILEGLVPQTTYNFRFAAQNDVGFGHWAAPQHLTMPKRSYPGEPQILSNSGEDGVVMSPYSDKYELTWKIPAHNGEPIDQYTIKYCPVSGHRPCS